MDPDSHGSGAGAEALLPLLLVALWVTYVVAALVCRHRGRPWSTRGTLLWTGGTVLCLVVLVGPLAELGHESLSGHMLGHIVLGMIGPLLLVRAAPFRLALRALPTAAARVLVRVLRCRTVQLISHPVVCGGINLLSVWLLYTTSLFELSQRTPWIHLVVHLHLLAFDYLSTAALVGVDPDRHRVSFAVRSMVLVVTAAGHAVLAKHLYGHPPYGSSTQVAERGGMLMYYAGDLVELAVVVLLCSAWYRATAPRTAQRHRLEG